MKKSKTTVENTLTFVRNDVTFLYQLCEGVCPKSYGMNVAKMAGVAEDVVQRAEEMAQKFEIISSNVRNQARYGWKK